MNNNRMQTDPIWVTLAINSTVRIILFGVNAPIVDDELKGIVH